MAALPQSLLEKLACPKCKGKLEYREREGVLDCHGCKLRFRVADGIPVLLLDEAETIT
ncbi:MAG: Trm112 family protein [Candidatus Zixiibacteriota bacterium]